MMRYSFWHGGGYTVGDLAWLVQAFKLLKNNEWKAETPLYFDGSGWAGSVREAAAVSLLNALAVNQTARTLYLQNAELDLKAQGALSLVFSKNSALRNVSLKNLRCNDDPMVIPEALFANKHLNELIIAQCTINVTGCIALAKMIQSSKSLVTLSLTKVEVSEEATSALFAAFRSSQSLRTLIIRGILFTTAQKAQLLDALSSNTSISSLLLEEMQWNGDDANAIAKLFAANTSIENLSLRRNDLQGEAIRVIVEEGLVQNKSLLSLKLSHNPIGDDGAKYLMEAVSRQSTLANLCLIHASISKQGCRFICNALRLSTGLRKLSLDGNHFEDCPQELLQAVKENVYVHSVMDTIGFLTKNSGNSSLWKQIDMYLTMNKAKRRIIRQDDASPGMITRVLAASSSQPDFIFEMLKQLPDCFASAGYC